MLVSHLDDLLARLSNAIAGAGAAAPALFVLAYAAAAIALIPASALTLLAGAIFGVAAGLAYVLVAAALGAIASFLIARYVARGRIERRVGSHRRLRQIDRAVGESGLRIMLLMRLSPAFPFGLQNYALGLTSVRLRDYAIALVGMIPGTLLYVSAGAAAREVAAAASGGAAPRGTAYYVVLAVGILATLAVTIVLGRIAKRALASSESGADE